MCCLFGLLDYGHTLTASEKNGILHVLATVCEERGKDATGIAYHSRGNLHIYKRPFAGEHMRFRVPGDAAYIMGHTRLTTQGNALHNYNNHPFLGTIKNKPFALAHNGVIYNDTSLRHSLMLPHTHIETDSYIAVQLLEREKSLNFDALRRTAEALRGSFTFTLLGDRNDFYIIKGDNPMCLYRFPETGIYLYASTEELLTRAMHQIKRPLGTYVKHPLRCGDILVIHADGRTQQTTFDDSALMTYYYPYSWLLHDKKRTVPTKNKALQDAYLTDLKSVASAFGYSSDDIDDLLAVGFTPDEIESCLYDGLM